MEYKTSLYDYGDELSYRLLHPWLRDSIYWMTAAGRKNKKTIGKLHNFSNRVIRERQATFKNRTGSYSQRKRLAMLDLLLKAKSEGANIDDEGIREEVDTFIFEVFSFFLSVLSLKIPKGRKIKRTYAGDSG